MKLALSLLLLAACSSPTPPRPVAPVSDAGPDVPAAVCDHLATLGCAEGTDPFCAVVTRRIMTDALTRFDASCVLNATTKDAAAKCPALRCP